MTWPVWVPVTMVYFSISFLKEARVMMWFTRLPGFETHQEMASFSALCSLLWWGYCTQQVQGKITGRLVLRFLLSAVCLAIEVQVALIHHIILLSHADCYFFLVPSAWYLFQIAQNIRLPDNGIYVYLRKQSRYIYCIHGRWLFFITALLGKGPHSIYFFLISTISL